MRIIRRAGLKARPQVFHNMRASHQSELAKVLPIHVACTWIGNTALIAGKHYLDVIDDYFEAASCATRAEADASEREMTGADTPLGMSAPAKSTVLQSLKGYPQGESNGRKNVGKIALSKRETRARTRGDRERDTITIEVDAEAWDRLPESVKDELGARVMSEVGR
jgi:hypothetical protein